MYTSETKLRVRYGETDKMGVVYHGHFALYFEIGRTEALRQINITYKSLEERGIMMPVVHLASEFKKPARYDDLLTVKTLFKEMPTAKTQIFYEVINEQDELVCKGETTLAFVDMKSNRITRCPSFLGDLFKPFFK